MTSIFDIFTVGIGPSSSHTVGPMRAARLFADALDAAGCLSRVTRIQIDFYGSLAATGVGHGSDIAVLLGLEGDAPVTVDIQAIAGRVAAIQRSRSLRVLGRHTVVFTPEADLCWHVGTLPLHSNGLVFSAYGASSTALVQKTYYSVGGGAVVEGDTALVGAHSHETEPSRSRFSSGSELLSACAQNDLRVSQVMLNHELAWRRQAEVRSGVLHMWQVMQDCVVRGCESEGVLPGVLRLPRRAPGLSRRLLQARRREDGLRELDLINLHALAVAEENASGGRVVTAPTNGAAGVIPAVLHYAVRTVPAAGPDTVVDFLLTAAAIGVLFKENASISAAEVGCQGEIGVACSMAAAGLTEVLGGTPEQVETAAEIGMEHHLGLTCDPVAGLVQVPCIERNAMGAVTAVNAARLALYSHGDHLVSLDAVIKTMHATGRDMCSRYRETAQGGLACHVDGIPESFVQC